jgi:hypothetical protein
MQLLRCLEFSAVVLGAVAVMVLLAMPLPSCDAAPSHATSDPLGWPEPSAQTRPWARWWWLGSAVDEKTITKLLEQYRDAGIGGVEICPIYGAKGYEAQYVPFLSARWMQLLAHVTTEARRLGLGVDLTDGTGWPFGGPNVSPREASAKVVLKAYDVAAGSKLGERLPDGSIQCVMAVSDAGERVDLTSRAAKRQLDWTAPASGKWRVYVAGTVSPVQKVKRAAPGGEGNVLDPYSVDAIDHYLGGFDRAFAEFKGPMPRAHFHDSFEYYGATWTRDFFEQFRARRGYDLREHLPQLLGEGERDAVARVKCDYRETISDLHLAYVARWAEWSHKHGGLAREQAHGAPANLLDVYAAADIPETEIFGDVDPRWFVMNKLASSAAHVSGRNLSSCESFTWLGEHFSVSLANVKHAADYIFLSGANHLFFHGIPYSPPDAPWPGWLFYAAVNFGPSGGLWHDLPAFNAYVARCQSILQSGRSDNDVLLYYPQHDVWQDAGGMLEQYGMHKQEEWLWKQPFYAAGMMLNERGYSFDAVSDRLLERAAVKDGKVHVGDGAYAAIAIPNCRLMPSATLKKIGELAKAGARVIVLGELPADVPGLGSLEARRAELKREIDELRPVIGKQVLVGSDLAKLLEEARVPREPMADQGLGFVRRTRDDGRDYFVANRSTHALDGWVALGNPAASVVLMDPLFSDHAGVATTRRVPDGSTQVYLQLKAGESCVLRTFAGVSVSGRAWKYFEPAGEPIALSGNWQVHFVEGGPELPRDFETKALATWTTLGDDNAKRFAGTAGYVIEFDAPGGSADETVLDLGRVCESARVALNGHQIATLFSPPYEAQVGRFLKPGRNTLEVDVTNLAANRVADLDRRGVQWKAFHEVNFVNRDYKPFDASKWPPGDSGLLGPVRLILMKSKAVSP